MSFLLEWEGTGTLMSALSPITVSRRQGIRSLTLLPRRLSLSHIVPIRCRISAVTAAAVFGDSLPLSSVVAVRASTLE